MTALLKGVLLLGATLLFGSVLLQHWLRMGRPAARLLAVVAALLLVGGSLLDIQLILASLPVDLDVWSYLTRTRHGLAVRWRVVVAAVLLVLSFLPRFRWLPALQLPGWLLLLFTFSYTSHAAAMAGGWALVTDWLHFVAAGVWSGVILAVLVVGELWLPVRRQQLLAAMRTVSAAGLASVLVVALTGSVSSLFHLAEPERFFGSDYSWALLLKLVLVALTVLLAALNRFRFLPQLEAGRPAGLRRALIIEAVLLVAVFMATGLLTTSSLPHGQDFPGVLENFTRLLDFLRR